MTKRVFTPLKGLNNEKNYLSGRGANSLLECVNVILRRAGVIQSRKGHPVLFSSGTYGSGWDSTSDTRNWAGLLEAPNGNLVIPWQEQSLSTSGVLTYDGNITTWDSLQETTDGGSSFVDATFDPQFTWPTAEELVWTDSRSLNSGQDNHIITSAAGLVVSSSTSYDSYIQSILPVVNTFDNITIQTGSIEQRWWNTGNRVNFRAVIEYIRADGIRTRSRPSHIEEIINSTGHGYARVGSVVVSSKNIVDYTKAFLKIYRTVQYDPVTPAPPDYFLCYEAELDQGVAGSSTVTFSNINLLLNDDAISVQENIYVGLGGETGAAAEEVNRTATVPVARDVVEFKGYTFYGNVYRAPFAKLTMLTYPTFGTPSITVEGNSVNLTDFSNAVEGDLPSNGVYTEDHLTYEGLDTTALSLVIDSVDGDTSGGSGTLIYSIVSDPTNSTSGKATNIRMTPEGKFNPDLFPSPGIACLTASGAVVHLFTYRDVEYSSTGGYVEFTGITTQGAATPPTLGAGDYALWNLPGISVENLPIYNKVNSSPSGVQLLPLYADYPTQLYMPFPIGRISEMASVSTARVDMFGVYKRSEIKKLDDAMKEFAKDYNASRAEDDPVAYHLRGSEPGTVFFEMNRAGTSGISSLYDSITASYTGAGATFAPDISSSTNIVTEDPHVRNGIVISKLGNPEEVSFEQVFAPLKIGKDDKKILRLAATSDDLYVFKEDGIYRLNVTEGLKNPQVTGVQPVDLTTRILAPESLQVIEERVYFLSNRGFCILQDNYIQVIDGNVQSEVRDLYTKVRKNTNLGGDEDRRLSTIKSFANTIQKLYCVSFPRTTAGGDHTVMVLNTGTGEWTKTDQQFIQAHVREDGRLVTVDEVYPYTTTPTTAEQINAATRDYTATKEWTFLREDLLSSGFEDDADQYDEEIVLTSATITNPTSTTLNITRTSATPSTVDNNIEDLIYRVRNREIWYYFATDDVYKKGAISGVSGDITLTFDVDDNISSLTTDNSSDKLYVGVSVDFRFNRFYPSASFTSTVFKEASFFDIGTYNGVTMSFGNGLSTDFDVPIDTDENSDVWRAFIPANSARGTHIISRVQHSRPFETFKLAGYAMKYDDTDSTATGTNDC